MVPNKPELPKLDGVNKYYDYSMVIKSTKFTTVPKHQGLSGLLESSSLTINQGLQSSRMIIITYVISGTHILCWKKLQDAT